MFGLIRAPLDKKSPAYRSFRLHYCGLCKSLARQYGQRTRVLLNWDVVFFSQLLSECQGVNTTGNCCSSSRIRSCFSIRNCDQDLNRMWDYCATLNMLLSKMQLADQIQDERGTLKWKSANFLLRNQFRKLTEQSEQLGISVPELEFWHRENLTRESNADLPEGTVRSNLDFYAEPTAEMTAQLMSSGATQAGCEDRSETFFKLGFRFGTLIYGLDALKDQSQDLRLGNFNFLNQMIGASQIAGEREIFENAITALAQTGTDLCESLQELKLGEQVTNSFVDRLEYYLYNNIELCKAQFEFARQPKIRLSIRKKFHLLREWIKSSRAAAACQEVDRRTLGSRMLNMAAVSTLAVLLFKSGYSSEVNPDWVGTGEQLLLLGGMFRNPEDKKQDRKIRDYGRGSGMNGMDQKSWCCLCAAEEAAWWSCMCCPCDCDGF